MPRPKNVGKLPERIGKAEGSRLLSISEDKFGGMVGRGELPKAIEGGWDPVELVAAYLFEQSDGVKVHLDEARLERIRHENAQMKGKHVLVDAVIEAFGLCMRALSENLDAIGGRLAMDLDGVSDGAVRQQICETIVAEAKRRAVDQFLERLVGIPGAKLETKNRGRADSATDTDAGRVGRPNKGSSKD